MENSREVDIRIKRGIRQYQQRLVSARQAGDIEQEWQALHYLGRAYFFTGNYTKAIDYYQQDLTFNRDKKKRYYGEAMALTNLSEAYFCLGNYPQSLDYYQQCLSLYQEIGNPSGIINVLNRLGRFYQHQGDYFKAIEYYQKSLTIAKQNERDLEPVIAESFAGLGTAYLSLCDYGKVIDYQQQCLSIAKDCLDEPLEGIALSNLGFAYLALGDYRQAIEYLQESLSLAQHAGNRLEEEASGGWLGTLYYYLNDYANAINYINQSLSISGEICKRLLEDYSLANSNTIPLSIDLYAKVIGHHQQSLAVARQISSRSGECLSLGHLGLAYLSFGEFAKGIEYLRQSLSMVREMGELKGQGIALNNLGVALFISGNFKEAEKILLEGIETWELIRKKLGDNDYFKVSIFEEQARTYQLLQEVLIAQEKPEEALEIAERGRARAFVELLFSRLPSTLEAIPDLGHLSLKQIKQIASKDQVTIVEYSIIYELNKPSELFIWVIQPTDKFAFRKISLNSLNITFKDIVADTRQSIGVRYRDQSIALAIAPGDLVKLHDDAPSWEPWKVIAVDAANSILSLRQSSFPEGLTIPRPVTDVATKVESYCVNNSRLQQLYQLDISNI